MVNRTVGMVMMSLLISDGPRRAATQSPAAPAATRRLRSRTVFTGTLAWSTGSRTHEARCHADAAAFARDGRARNAAFEQYRRAASTATPKHGRTPAAAPRHGTAAASKLAASPATRHAAPASRHAALSAAWHGRAERSRRWSGGRPAAWTHAPLTYIWCSERRAAADAETNEQHGPNCHAWPNGAHAPNERGKAGLHGANVQTTHALPKSTASYSEQAQRTSALQQRTGETQYHTIVD